MRVWGDAVGVGFAFIGACGVVYYFFVTFSQCLPDKYYHSVSFFPLGKVTVDLCPGYPEAVDAPLRFVENGD